jgi:hypothetical protein
MQVKRCGTCHFGKIVGQDITRRLCHGAPPSAIQIPSPQGQMTLKMARPVVSVTDEACALYREKDSRELMLEGRALQEDGEPRLKQ